MQDLDIPPQWASVGGLIECFEPGRDPDDLFWQGRKKAKGNGPMIDLTFFPPGRIQSKGFKDVSFHFLFFRPQPSRHSPGWRLQPPQPARRFEGIILPACIPDRNRS